MSDNGMLYFDGDFWVRKVPKGQRFYHGSALLADNVIEFPTGVKFSEPYKFGTRDQRVSIDVSFAANSPDSIMKLVSEQIPVVPGWYADLKTAKIYVEQGMYEYDTKGKATAVKYPKCRGTCIFSYKTTREFVFIDLFHEKNIPLVRNFMMTKSGEPGRKLAKYYYKLYNEATIPNNPDNAILQISKKDRTKSQIFRNSIRSIDLPLTQFLCSTLFKKHNYQGYVSQFPMDDWRGRRIGAKFHIEAAICNPFRNLERDLEDPNDWQYNSSANTGGIETKKLINVYKRFKTTNVDFHSGNLYEHSVWTCLYTEKILKEELITFNSLIRNDKSLAAITSLAGFVHDIGKITAYISNGYDKKKNQNILFNAKLQDYIYFDEPDHPSHGAKIFNYPAELFIYGDPKGVTNRISITNFLRENFPSKDDPFILDARKKITIVIAMHWKLGDIIYKPLNNKGILSKLAADKEEAFRLYGVEIDKKIDTYLKHLLETCIYFKYEIETREDFLTIMEMCFIISIADVMGTQPIGVGRMKDNDFEPPNIVSEYFPYISNVPKNYRGGDMFTFARYKKTCVPIFDGMVKIIDKSYKI